MEGLQKNRYDLECGIGTKDALVIFMNRVEVTFSFFSQYYVRHVLPT